MPRVVAAGPAEPANRLWKRSRDVTIIPIERPRRQP